MEPFQAKVLYVDDQREMRRRFSRAVEQLCGVVSAEDGASALAEIEREAVGVVVVSGGMPKAQTSALLEEIRRRRPAIIRILVTPYSALQTTLRAVSSGLLTRYLIAPWNGNELRDIIRWALEVYNSGQQASMVQRRLVETERFATIGQITTAILHELGQPLSALGMNSMRLQQLADGQRESAQSDSAAQELAQELAELAADFHHISAFMGEILQGVRRILRPDEGDVPVTSGADPVAVIQRALALSRATQEGARLCYRGPQQVARAAISSVELLLVLLNLVANAQQSLGKQASGGTVVVSVEEESTDLVIGVQDDGAGMNEDTLVHATMPFFTTRADGTGLGLPQCRRTIEGYGGRFEIESALGEGTRVTFTVAKAIASRDLEPSAEGKVA